MPRAKIVTASPSFFATAAEFSVWQIVSAKRAATRQGRLAKLVEACAHGERL